MSSQSPEPHRDEPMVRDGGESNHAIKSESNDEARSPSPRGSLSQDPLPGDEAKECSSFKRKSFLERNRKAAQKCRLRKKEWCASLEAKVKYLESVNESLQNTVISFRSEIVCLQSKLDELQQQLQQQQQFQHQHVHRCCLRAWHHTVRSSADFILCRPSRHLIHARRIAMRLPPRPLHRLMRHRTCHHYICPPEVPSNVSSLYSYCVPLYSKSSLVARRDRLPPYPRLRHLVYQGQPRDSLAL